MFAFIGFGLPLHGENTPPKACIVTIAREQGQVVRFGIDAERLWFFRPERCEELAAKAVGELKVDYARVPINCAYAREEGVTNLAAYTEVILPMMKAFRRHNPKLKFFASPRPLKEAYDRKKDASLIAANFKDGKIGMAAYPVWVGGHKRLLKRQFRKVRTDRWARYLADYLNLMAQHGLDIAYLDLMNEDQSMWKRDIDIILSVIDQIPSHLNPGVALPKIVFPSTWSPGNGMTRFLDLPSVAPRRAEILKKIDVVSTHNTPDANRNAFNESDLVAFAKAVRAVDPQKELWNTEMHGWTGTRNPSDDIRNSVVLWKHLAAGFSGIDTWLFFGSWKGAPHPMVYSGRGKGPETTAKYEIYKSVVNDMCNGRYRASNTTDEHLVPAVLTKNGRMLVSLLNRGDKPLAAQVRLPEGLNMRGDLEVRTWESAKNDRVPRISRCPGNGDKKAFRHTIPAQSLVHFVFAVHAP